MPADTQISPPASAESSAVDRSQAFSQLLQLPSASALTYRMLSGPCPSVIELQLEKSELIRIKIVIKRVPFFIFHLLKETNFKDFSIVTISTTPCVTSLVTGLYLFAILDWSTLYSPS